VEVYGQLHHIGLVVMNQDDLQMVTFNIDVTFNGFNHSAQVEAVIENFVATGNLLTQLVQSTSSTVLRMTGKEETQNDTNVVNKILTGFQWQEDLRQNGLQSTEDKIFQIDQLKLLGSYPNISTGNIRLQVDFSFSASVPFRGTLPSMDTYIVIFITFLGLSFSGSSQLGQVVTAVTDALDFELNEEHSRYHYTGFITILLANENNLVSTVNDVFEGQAVTLDITGQVGASNNVIQRVVNNWVVNLNFSFADQSENGATKVDGGTLSDQTL
jgi:hypothetical protein